MQPAEADLDEPETAALRRYLRRKSPLVTSALARTEVARALLSFGAVAVGRGSDVLRRLNVVRINDRILRSAGSLPPMEAHSLDGIHLATTRALGSDLARVCTYDERMADAASGMGMAVVAPR